MLVVIAVPASKPKIVLLVPEVIASPASIPTIVFFVAASKVPVVV